jgi:hypothetical protein
MEKDRPLVSRIKRALPSLLSASVWLIGQGWEWPPAFRGALLTVGALGLAASVVFEGVKLLLRALPFPWFPRQWWRAVRWLQRRPSVNLIVMTAPTIVVTETGLIDSCALHLTLTPVSSGDIVAQ